MKLGLGTVQFGLDYGYTNKNGIPTDKEIERIFDCALKNGVSYIDTANLYGNAEEIIGKFLPKKNHFKVISKTPKFKTKIITLIEVGATLRGRNSHMVFLDQFFMRNQTISHKGAFSTLPPKI